MPAKKIEKKQEKKEEKPAIAEKEKAPKKVDDKKSKLEALKEKAKQLEASLTETEDKNIDLKKKVKPEEEENLLIPIEDYLKSSIHLGTRVITPDMKKFVYKRRADGLAVFNTNLLDEKIQETADFISKYAPEDIIIVCKREAGWRPVRLFSNLTNIRSFTKQYPPGILTNPNLEEFMEAELVIICDPWIDKNALNDSKRVKIPVVSICDTNNYTQGITKVLPGNNKSAKSLGMILYLLAKLYTEKRKLKVELPKISEWIENWDNLVPPK